MDEIKIIMDTLDIRELCLEVIGEYSKDCTKIEKDENDIIITVERDSYIDKIYGREIQGKYYFARHQFISKEKPYIDYYEEFFSNGVELNFN